MRKTYYISIAIVGLFLGYLFFLDNNEKKEKDIDLNNVKTFEKEEQKSEVFEELKPKTTFDTKDNPIQKTEIHEKKEELKVKKNFVLKSSIDSKQKFRVNLVSKEKIENNFYEKNNIRYITISGIIEYNGEVSSYPMSLEEYRLEFLNDVYLEVENLTVKKSYSCEAYFFSDLDPKFEYNIKIDVYDDSIDCYVDSQSDNSNLEGLENKTETKLVKSPKDLSKEFKLEPSF